MFNRQSQTIPLVTFGGRSNVSRTPDLEIMRADPQAMLAQQRIRQPRRMPSLLGILAIACVVAELSGIPKFQPSVIAGKAARNFYGEIMQEDNNKALDLSEQQPYAEARGTREAQESHWNGLCAAALFVDTQLAAYCMAMTGAYFAEALPPARDYRNNYVPRR